MSSMAAKSAGGAHDDAIRCFDLADGAISLLTGGDDGRVAMWRAPTNASTTAPIEEEEPAAAEGLAGGHKAARFKAKVSRPKPYDKPPDRKKSA